MDTEELLSMPSSHMAVRLPKSKNKADAEIQITAEQLIREALANQSGDILPPRVSIDDELPEYLMKKRAEFENNLRKQREHIHTWIKYATWEEGLGEMERSRSILERGIVIDYRNPAIWLSYAEMEMRGGYIKHARNVWERAIDLLPRIDQLWYKYALMEEILHNYNGWRKILQRWLDCQPTQIAYYISVQFEVRMNEIDNARQIFARLIVDLPSVEVYIQAANFEQKYNTPDRARDYFENAILTLGSEAISQKLFATFAEFEISQGEFDRARTIFNYAMSKLSQEDAPELYQKYLIFEKKHGSPEIIENMVINKRRVHYEALVSHNSQDYDAWFNFARLEEASGNSERIREVYERAIAAQPSQDTKLAWSRYIYLWIYYAVWEELHGDENRAGQIWETALAQVPHKIFSFSKLWIQYAQYLIRRQEVEKARQIFQLGVKKLCKNSIFEAYINFEAQLGNIDKWREVFQKWVEKRPNDPVSWIRFAEFEKALEEVDRFRYIMNIAIQREKMANPEQLWKAFIDMELDSQEYDRVAELYEKLLGKTQHIKVWTSYAAFFYSIQDTQQGREVYRRAEDHFIEVEDKESRLVILETWIDAETDADFRSDLVARLPQKVKKRRQITEAESGEPVYEEYLDYIFPDEKSEKLNLKLLEQAHKWKNLM